MHFVDINEAIEVISYFDGRKMRPLRFRWRGRVYRVAHVNGIWNAIQGQNREYHYHISTRESGSFELVYHSSAMNWKLGRACLEDS